MNSSTVAIGPHDWKLLKGSEYAFSCSHEKVVKIDEAVSELVKKSNLPHLIRVCLKSGSSYPKYSACPEHNSARARRDCEVLFPIRLFEVLMLTVTPDMAWKQKASLSCFQCLPDNVQVGARGGAKPTARQVKVLESGEEHLDRIHSGGKKPRGAWSKCRLRRQEGWWWSLSYTLEHLFSLEFGFGFCMLSCWQVKPLAKADEKPELVECREVQWQDFYFLFHTGTTIWNTEILTWAIFLMVVPLTHRLCRIMLLPCIISV